MKKLTFLIFISLLFALLFACGGDLGENLSPLYIEVNGDIVGVSLAVDLNKVAKAEFSTQDGNLKGHELDKILAKTSLNFSGGGSVMITAKDGTSALIDLENAKGCFVVETENGFNLVAPNHPRVLGIKEIKELTVISKSKGADFKILYLYGEESYSFGNAKMLFYEQEGGVQTLNGITARKFTPLAKAVTAQSLVGESCFIYLDNFNIVKSDNSKVFSWESGRVCYDGEAVFGIVAGAGDLISKAFYDIKSALDGGEKVIAVLLDGLSLNQVNIFNSQLSILKSGYSATASVYPAISNVALASIITGATPFETDIYERNVKFPAVPDIFDYATETLGLEAIFVEGNSRLVRTNIKQELHPTDDNGFTDSAVYQTARQAVINEVDFVFAHFHGIDDINHDYSPNSAEALAKIKEIEDYIERLIRGFSGKLIIISDHGHSTVDGKGVHEGVFDIYNMFVPYYILDITA
ncbi:MAG: alkaline phosphatase family protein [Firmicutes bacterium]|nr:alkaline phosphatase family protein [Bacillota bacterium]